MKTVNSAQNSTYKALHELLETKGIKKQKRALVFGKKVVEECLSNPEIKNFGIILNAVMQPPVAYRGDILALSNDLYDELDIFGTRSPILEIEIPEIKPWDESLADDGCTLFIPFQDPINVGAVIRSAAAFGVKNVVILEESSHPFHPKCLRAASGSLFKLNFFKGPKLKELRAGELPLFALDAGGKDLNNFKFPKRFGLVPGVEGPGFPPDFKPHEFLSIPIERNVESLNAMVATSIALYEWRKSGQ